MEALDTEVEHKKSVQLHLENIKDHEGHDQMHFQMMVIFFVAIIIAQFIIVFWKARHSKSYQSVTLLGVWMIPLYYCINLLFWRMFLAWLFFTIVSMYVLIKTSAKPIDRSTPRLVYRWFLLVYRVSMGFGVVGYTIIMMLLGLANSIPNKSMESITEAGVILVFYGLYFGVLGRDLAEYCVDNISVSMKFSKSSSEDPEEDYSVASMCLICNMSLFITNNSSSSYSDEPVFKLSCGHTYHEFCIRGWCIVGKKETCPFCREKVDMSLLLSQPWQKPHMLFGTLIDVVRYFVAWFPLILLVCRIIYYLLDLS